MRELQLKQAKLDEFIIEKQGLQNKNLFMNKVIALDIELSEFMNNIESFKHWKINKGKPNILEESCDCLHFILSLSNEFNYELSKPYIVTTKIVLGLDRKECMEHHSVNQLYTWTKDLLWRNVYENRDKIALNRILWMLVRTLMYCGYTWEDLLNAYNEKYEINIKRQEEGY